MLISFSYLLNVYFNSSCALECQLIFIISLFLLYDNYAFA